jgi:hypothetical protein
MSIKMHNLNREQVQKMALDYEMFPAFEGQNPYIASGPLYEILVSQAPGGLYEAELLDKKQMEESLQQTIRAFKEYGSSPKR